MDFENNKGNYFQLNAQSCGDQVNVGESNMEAIKRIELELAFASEKLLNLEMLVMEIAHHVTDFDPLLLDNESTSAETVEKAFELDILYGILDSEVKELDNLIISLQMDIKIAEQKVYEEESGDKVKAKLDTAMASLKQMQDLIADIRKESAKFEKAIDFSHEKAGTSEASGCENGHISSHATMQTEDQRRNVLKMLEKSIASELDLEKKLSDSRCIVDELKLKLHHLEQESYFLEESIEAISERMFAAENSSELFLGTSKEIIGKFNAIQFNLSASRSREDDLKLRLEQSMMKLSSLESTLEEMQEESDKAGSQEADQNLTQSTPESLALQHKLQEPEEWLRESDLQLRLAKPSAEASQEDHNILQPDLSKLENSIKNLKDDVSWAESRAQNAEVRCMQLTQANIELNEELSSLKSRGSDKASFLERKLKESNTQLEHAKASVDAIVEQQGMLKSTMSDMEHMIEDLKGKVLKAEARAENAESKCTLLTDTNLELSEELSFLRGRVESLENSLHEASHVKMSTVKDIGIRTKIITDLVKKLALERERLHLQIATLTKNNKILSQKCKGNVNDSTQLRGKVTGKDIRLQSTILPGEIVPVLSSSSQTEVNKITDSLAKEEAKMTAAEDMLDTVRSMDPPPLNWKYIVITFLVCLSAVLVYFLHQEDGSTV